MPQTYFNSLMKNRYKLLKPLSINTSEAFMNTVYRCDDCQVMHHLVDHGLTLDTAAS